MDEIRGRGRPRHTIEQKLANPKKIREHEKFIELTQMADFALDVPIEKATTEFDYEQFMFEAENVRRMALKSDPPNLNVALHATVEKGKAAGLFVNQTIVGTPNEFAQARTREEILAMIERRAGPEAVTTFLEMISKLTNERQARMIEDARSEETSDKNLSDL